jgi:hypothetical protein
MFVSKSSFLKGERSKFYQMNSSRDFDHQEIDVFVNVYDMADFNKYGYWAGIGIFHSAIEILEKEYAFVGHELDFTGVLPMEPKQGLPGTLFRESIKLGTIKMTSDEFEGFIQTISNEFIGSSYNLLTKNCNHFSNEMSQRLFKKDIPSWINRLATIGK